MICARSCVAISVAWAAPIVVSKGSMKMVSLPSLRRNADWPYHSTCMLLLSLEPGLLGKGDDDRVVVRTLVDHLAAAHQRRAGGDQAGDDRERERRVQAALK